MIIEGSIKFRSLEKMLKIQERFIGVYSNLPSNNTMKNWVLKLGYYELTRTKEIADDWIVILDHSVQFGHTKVFVVLGIREKDFLNLNRPLKYTDLTSLLISNKNNWNGELVCNEIKELEPKIGKIKYAVGDYGSDLKKGLRLAGIKHVHDLSHLISNIVKSIYEKDKDFVKLKEQMNVMRKNFIQTNISSVVPPKGRKKSEYQNFDTIISWANAVMNLINNKLQTPKQKEILKEFIDGNKLDRIKKEFSWINDFSTLIEELSEISKSIKTIEKDMKHNGLSEITLKKCISELKKLETKNGKKFSEKLISQIEFQFEKFQYTDTILCSSDIIESIFGKYKNCTNNNPMASITNLILTMASFTCELTDENIIKSMETTTINDIKDWSKKNIGHSLFFERKYLLSA